MTNRYPRRPASSNPASNLYEGVRDSLPALDDAAFTRIAHHIWDLRAAEDEKGGYTLARKREERSVDLRKISSLCPHRLLIRQGQVQPVVINIKLRPAEQGLDDDDDDALMLDEEPGLEPVEDELGEFGGEFEDEEEALAPGELGPPEVGFEGLEDELDEDELDEGPISVTTEDGEVMDAEPDMLVRPDSCPCVQHLIDELLTLESADAEMHGPDPQMMMREGPDSLNVAEGLQPRMDMPLSPGMEPAVGPSSQMADMAPMEDLILIVASLQRTAIDLNSFGQWVQPTRAFAPAYMGGSMRIDPDERKVYKLEGFSPANPQFDRLYGIPNPILPHPNARERSPEWALNNRVRLVPYGGGEPIFVTPTELDRFFTPAPEQDGGSRFEPSEMPGEPAMMPENLGTNPGMLGMPGEPAMTPSWEDERNPSGLAWDAPTRPGTAPGAPPIGRPSVSPFEDTQHGATSMRPYVRPIQPRRVSPETQPGANRGNVTQVARPPKK